MSASPPVDVSGRALALRDVDLDRFLHPRTVAVIGASEASRKPNTAMTRKIKGWADAHGATFYPVHPTHETVLGERCYPTVFDVPGDLDLAVILTGKAVDTFEEVLQRQPEPVLEWKAMLATVEDLHEVIRRIVGASAP